MKGFSMKQPVITQEQIDIFLQKLQADGKKQAVIVEYRRNLNRLYQTAEGNGGVLTKEILDEWRRQQAEQGIAPGTVTNRVVKINHFLRYLEADELCFPNGGRQDLTGKRFGNLVAIEPLKEKRSGRSICWKCRCMICGKEKAIPAYQLNKGVQISCGCYRANQLQKTNGYIEGTSLKNVFSKKINKNNTSGYKGVFRKRNRWAACIQYKKKNYYLGSYDRLEDAVEARKEAENWVRDDAGKLLEQFAKNENQQLVVSESSIKL